MKRYMLFVLIVSAMIIPLVCSGCKSKIEKSAEESIMAESYETPAVTTEGQQGDMLVTEPAETVGKETIPPTAAIQPSTPPGPLSSNATSERDRDIQRGLKLAGFYHGAIDGKIGPLTKTAIRAFQQAKGLKVDGKVGPVTWGELEKYLTR